MSLSQQAFCIALFDAQAAAPKALRDSHGRAAGRRFDVYRNNVAVSLREALQVGFPVITKLIGEENFHAICAVFLRQHPPSSPLLMFYGAEFPQFLRDFAPLGHLGYLGDVAEVELALRRAYHAADHKGIDPQSLGQIPPEAMGGLRLHLADSVQVVASPWPIFDIWAFNARTNHPKPRAGAQDVLITRAAFDPEPHRMPPGTTTFVRALQRGAPLGDAAEQGSAGNGDFPLSQVLACLLTHGMITAIVPR